MFFRSRAAEAVLPTYTHIPELAVPQVRNTVKALAQRHERNLPSYGAYIVRRGGVQVALDALKLYQKTEVGQRQIQEALIEYSAQRDGATGYDGELHADAGRRNDIGAHWTKTGTVQFALLLDNSHGLKGKVLDNGWELGAELLDKGTCNGASPGRVLSGELNPDDVLLFDHTLYHVFRTTSEYRESRVFWLE